MACSFSESFHYKTRPTHKPMSGHVYAHQRCRHQFKLVSKAERSSRGGRGQAAREREADTLHHGLSLFRMSTTHRFAKMWTGFRKLLLLLVILVGFLLANGKRQCSTLSVRLCKCKWCSRNTGGTREFTSDDETLYEEYYIQKHNICWP